jgi:hypothetical protein
LCEATFNNFWQNFFSYSAKTRITERWCTVLISTLLYCFFNQKFIQIGF